MKLKNYKTFESNKLIVQSGMKTNVFSSFSKVAWNKSEQKVEVPSKLQLMILFCYHIPEMSLGFQIRGWGGNINVVGIICPTWLA